MIYNDFFLGIDWSYLSLIVRTRSIVVPHVLRSRRLCEHKPMCISGYRLTIG